MFDVCIFIHSPRITYYSKVVFYIDFCSLRSSENAFIMQSKSTVLEFLDGNSLLQIPPPNSPRKILQVQMTSLQSTMCFVYLKFSFTCRGGLLFVESVDILFAFDVLACRILDCASLLCGLLSSKLRCLRSKIEILAF